MKNNDYLLPGLAAIAVAILSPLYWMIELGSISSSFPNSLTVKELGVSNILFLVVGILSIVVYSGLIKILHDHFNNKKLDIALISMMVWCVIFYGGTFFLDALSAYYDGELSVVFIQWLWIGGMIVFGVLDVLIAVLILKDSQELSSLLKSFAIVNLVMGFFELTVIFSIAAIFIFPVVFVILAVGFFRKPEMVEIV